MRLAAVIVILSLFATRLAGQCGKEVDQLLLEGDSLLNLAIPNFQEAIKSYTAAIIACPNRADEGKVRLSEMVEGMNALQRRAKRERRENEAATKVLQTELLELENALTKLDSLRSAFYYYANRFALVYGQEERSYINEYYFIDTDGEYVERLEKWDKAEQFDSRGLARVWGNGDSKPSLLDTFGTVYSAVTSIEHLNVLASAIELQNDTLTQLPTELWHNDQLKIIVVEGDSINELPEAVSNLQDLVILDLKGLKLNALPASLGELTKLRYLDVRENRISELPESVGQLQSLATLHMARNDLRSLPTSFGNLNSLVGIDLSANELSSLPSTIGRLKMLLTLELSRNKLELLPSSIGELNNLTHLDLHYNKLSELPTSLGELKNLTYLDLRFNRLTELPFNIESLSALVFLRLGGNDLSELSSAIGRLTSLTRLGANNNGLQRLPDNIGNLVNLEHLNLNSNRLVGIPESIGRLRNLRSLYLNNNSISDLPSSFWKLGGLERLELQSNKLQSISTSVRHLRSLKLLDLRNNDLQSLQVGILELDNLEKLYLEGNPIKRIPQPFWDQEILVKDDVLQLLSSLDVKSDLLEIREMYERIKKHMDLSSSDYRSLVPLLFEAKLYFETIDVGTEYVKNGGRNLETISKIGVAYLYTGDFQQAEKLYEQYLEDANSREVFLRELEKEQGLKLRQPDFYDRIRTLLRN